jgi:NOL1/NOP2/fmu family ribosome biogenesis protein
MLTTEFKLAGSYLYEAGDRVDNLAGLKLTHPGRWLGVLKTNRFEPSHVLTVSLNSHQAQNVCNLEISDPYLAYDLAGERI